jgi:hypothetical protein
MSDETLRAIIVASPGILLGVAALWKIGKVHHELNSRLDEWKEETKVATKASNIAAKAEGVKEEKERPK